MPPDHTKEFLFCPPNFGPANFDNSDFDVVTDDDRLFCSSVYRRHFQFLAPLVNATYPSCSIGAADSAKILPIIRYLFKTIPGVLPQVSLLLFARKSFPQPETDYSN